jgi:hypothetical protein
MSFSHLMQMGHIIVAGSNLLKDVPLSDSTCMRRIFRNSLNVVSSIVKKYGINLCPNLGVIAVFHYWKITEFWQRQAICMTSQTWTSSQKNDTFHVFAVPFLIIIGGFVLLTSLANAAHPSCRIKRTK